ncbi:MAG TPA: carboxypeptidase-like regulatory domain-containing protein [Gemmataceae bacterium]|nr:carboxypeptidase-like regulatory domain-containing protein [Gemmataceae bacterium]
MLPPRMLAPGFLAACLLLAGCSDQYGGRMEVSGTVKLKGQPAPNGAVLTFVPLENQGTEGQATTSGGGFTIPRQYGLKPGKYEVRATAGDGKTAVNPVDSDEPPGPGGGTNIVSKDVVPKGWKQEVTVTKEGPNTFEITIP